MHTLVLRLFAAVSLLCAGTSCMTAYDAYGRPIQAVDPGAAALGAAAIGVAAYALGNSSSNHKYSHHGYRSSSCSSRPVYYSRPSYYSRGYGYGSGYGHGCY